MEEHVEDRLAALEAQLFAATHGRTTHKAGIHRTGVYCGQCGWWDSRVARVEEFIEKLMPEVIATRRSGDHLASFPTLEPCPVSGCRKQLGHSGLHTIRA